jgi:hypothetical protein
MVSTPEEGPTLTAMTLHVFSSFLANWCRVSADVQFLDFRRIACTIELQITGKSNILLNTQFVTVIADLDHHGH